MKWCLNFTVDEEYLKKADEIKCFWQDHNKHPDVLRLLELNKNARILIQPSFELTLFEDDYKWLQEQYILCKQNMAVIVNDDRQALHCKELKLPFIYAYPARTFQQLNRMKNIGACDAYIDDILCHALDVIEEYFDELQIRVTANSCGWGTMPGVWDGIEGSWFRPEDLWQIEQIDVAEFRTNLNVASEQFTKNDICKQEQALYRIYAERHEYEGRVSDFVYDFLNKEVLNRLLPTNWQERRSNCHMKCMEGRICHHCRSLCHFAEYEVSQTIKKNVEELTNG